MNDVFVSYKAEDRRRIKPLVEALQGEGFSVWWDEQIGGGAAWRQTIESELNAAKCVIVIWSTRSVGPDGTFVQDEATRAQQRHVYVPVLIDKVHLPLGFGETQALPLTGWHGNQSDPKYQAVLVAVRRNLGGKRRAGTAAVSRTAVDRRAVLAGGAVAAAAVAGVGGWALLRPSSASASGSIAVLPFANLSGDPAQAYFSDGVAEEIRSALARIAGLKVVGRTSSEAVRNDDAETASKKLGVANILTGSVRQSPSTIRISAELVDGHSGIDKWSQDYDRSPGDAIKIQTDIAENVASALSAALGTAARAAISLGGTSNPEAQRLFIQAGALDSGAARREQLQQALKLLDSAIAIDPNYADAYARKSGVLTSYTNNFATGPQDILQARTESLHLAQMALKIAPNLPRGHRALFSLYSSNLQFAPALAEIKRARQLAPGDADVLATFSGFVGTMGEINEALKLDDQAIGADPLNPSPYNARISILFHGRRYADAIDYATQLQRNSPTLFLNRPTVGDCLLLLGRFQEAQSYYDSLPPDYWWRLTSEAILAIRAGDRARVQAKLAKLQQTNGDAASFQYGEIYAQLGDKDRALAALERAYAVKDPGLIATRIDPFLDPLRSDPRFQALLKKLDFPA